MKIEICTPKYIQEVGALAERQENVLLPLPNKETENDRLFIVCDAKGNDNCGDVVSHAMCTALDKWFNENVAEGEPVNEERLRQALESLCMELAGQKAYCDRNIRLSMGLLYLHSDGATVAHIGDCRVYHARAKKNNSFLSWFKKDYAVLYQSVDYPSVRLGKTDCVAPEVAHITDILPDDVFTICNAGMLEMDETANDTFISSIMSHRTGVMSPKEANLDYFKKEIARITCIYNHSAWIIKIKNIS